MRKMLLCVQRNISAMSCLHMEREIDVKHRFLLLNTCLTAMLEQYTLCCHEWLCSSQPGILDI